MGALPAALQKKKEQIRGVPNTTCPVAFLVALFQGHTAAEAIGTLYRTSIRIPPL